MRATPVPVWLQRISQLPDLPTVAESGLSGYRFEFWYGLLVPAKTLRTIVARLNREITGILNQPEVRNRWISLGAEPAPTTPGQFDKLIAEDIAALTKLARASNIKAD